MMYRNSGRVKHSSGQVYKFNWNGDQLVYIGGSDNGLAVDIELVAISAGWRYRWIPLDSAGWHYICPGLYPKADRDYAVMDAIDHLFSGEPTEHDALDVSAGFHRGKPDLGNGHGMRIDPASRDAVLPDKPCDLCGGGSGEVVSHLFGGMKNCPNPKCP